MKSFENFMTISASYEDEKEITGHNISLNRVYSKIVVQFHNQEDFDKAAPEYSKYELISQIWNLNTLQYITYSLNERAFDRICGISENYDCDVYQFCFTDYEP